MLVTSYKTKFTRGKFDRYWYGCLSGWFDRETLILDG